MTFADGKVEAHVDLRLYRLGAVKKSAYKLAKKCTVVLGRPADDTLPITFQFAPGTGEATAKEAVRRFFEELLDQELREEVAEETESLRKLILAHAFSGLDVVRGE